MDDFSTEFDPTGEYATIDCDTPDASQTDDKTTEQPLTNSDCDSVTQVQNNIGDANRQTVQHQNIPPYGNYNAQPAVPQQPYFGTPNYNTQNFAPPYPVQNRYQPYMGSPVQPYMRQNPGQPMQQMPMPYAPPVYYPQYPAQPTVQPQPYPVAPVSTDFRPPVDPTSPNFNPYATKQTPNNTPQQKTPTKTKVFIGVMIGLLVVLAIALIVVCTRLPISNQDDHPLAQFSAESSQPDNNVQDEYNYLPNVQSYDGEYYEYDIVLQADEGQTQILSESDKQNVYPADKDAKDLKLENLPKDKDNSKHTTQSAYNAVTNSVVSIVCYDGAISDNYEDIAGEGTGTIITSDGYIITNSHVINNSKSYTINVTLNNAKEYTAKVVGFDPRTDLAVLKIDAKDLPYVTFSNPEHIEVGQDIVAIGNPGGSSFQNSLTKGIVSAVDRELALSSLVKYIQIDAAINPGNSGGPLCNIYGQVIGINTAKISSMDYEGMGFAIPSDTVIEIANDIIKYGYVQDRVRIGLLGTEVYYEMAYSYNLPYGILVTEIDKTGPMYNCGVLKYDILTQINGKTVETFQDVYSELENYKPGDTVSVTVYRLNY